MAYFDKYGVKYSDDSKTLIRCPKEFNGAYVIPNGVETIAYDAFNFCRGLTAITIPSGVRHIEDRAFEFCEKLESVVLPNSLKSIGYSAFSCCANLLSVVLPDGLDCICDNAFDQCENLTSIAIPESVTWIGQGVLRYCDKLATPIYNSRIFAYLPSSYEGDYSIPESINIIAGDAFSECEKLTSIKLPSNVSKIGKGAFADCKSLSKITIPDGVTKIEEGTFYGCCNLEAIKLPNSIEIIEHGAFFQCEKLESLTIPDSVKEIHGGAFGLCRSLKSISIPPKAEFCEGEYMFRDCTHLQSIKFPDKITSIDERMFLECSSLTSITIPNSVTEIGKCAFEGCTALTSVEIPNSVTNIDVGAFAGCAGLTSLEIPNSVTNIDVGAFAGCSSLTSIEIPNSVTNIKESAFNGCISLSAPVYNKHVFAYLPISFSGAYVIPEGINLIAGSAFQKCIGLTSLEIPNSVTSIGNYAFAYCSGLTSIKIPNSVTEIGSAAFFNLTSIQEICIPKGQKARFLQMGLKEYEDIIVERDNEELTILLNLAKAYELGIGVAKNMAQSVLYYTQAAEKGSAEAAYRLAEWYQNGEVLPLDLNKALDLYKKAAKSGYKDAEEKAQRIQQQIEENEIPYYLFFDTETAGLPPKGKYDVPVTNPDFWPRLVQIAWILTDKEGNVINRKSKIIYPNGFSIPASATAIHHITTEHAMQVGEPLRDVLGEFMRDLLKAEKIVCHYVKFDQHIVGAELYSMDMDYKALMDKSSICTMTSKSIIDYCALPNPNEGYDDYKWPKLEELYYKLFDRKFNDAHDALADISATKECFFELRKRGVI